MNYEGMWDTLKVHLNELAENIERSIGDAKRPSYTENVNEIYRLVQEDIVRERKKSTLRIIRNILEVMESMEEAYR